MSRTLQYSVVDVFAERALEGNALAIFHDGRGLSDEEMQALARETNLSETTFIMPSDDESAGIRVRIFTAQEELPFAGHPTLGTASWLHLNHPTLRGAEQITLQLNVGPISVFFDRAENTQGVFATMQQNDPVFGTEYDPDEVARVIGMDRDDLLPGYAPQTVSTGNPFCIVALRSVEVLERLAIPPKQSAAWLAAHQTRWFYCIAPKDENAEQPVWRARMQFYSGEDPATGSAAGCCIGWMVKNGLVRSKATLVLEQGVEMLRPSRIRASAKLCDSHVNEVRISGRTIPVATGSFFLL